MNRWYFLHKPPVCLSTEFWFSLSIHLPLLFMSFLLYLERYSIRSWHFLFVCLLRSAGLLIIFLFQFTKKNQKTNPENKQNPRKVYPSSSICFFLYWGKLRVQKAISLQNYKRQYFEQFMMDIFPYMFLWGKGKSPIMRSCCTLLFVYITPSA